MATGKITQIIGAVIDVEFPRDSIPKIYEALKLKDVDLTIEVHEASPHTVTVPLLAGSPTNVKGRLAGRTAEAHGGLLSFPEVPPGSHLLLLYTSDCP